MPAMEPGDLKSSSEILEANQVKLDDNESELYDGSTTDHHLPPSTTVEPGEASESASSSNGRIPSSVFETSDAAEWSVASNESLFSIHMGNMSFTKEQLNFMYKSGELGYPCDSQPNENGIKASDLDGASMRGILKDNVQDANHVDFLRNASNNIGSISQHSDKSFAFPILAGADSYHKCSGSITPDLKLPALSSQPSTPKVVTVTESLPEPPTPPKEKTPKASQSQVKWFSWFPCCTSR